MINKIENHINRLLNNFPFCKKAIKRLYQLFIYISSQKIKSIGNIIAISPNDENEYFFGYYDKSPWDGTDRFMLCLRTNATYKSVAPKEPADIILFDTQDNNSITVVGQTRAWNIQQGCMLQWLGPDFKERIIYNDFRSGKYCSIIYNLKTNRETVIDMPVYSVSQDGNFALTLDFSRLHRLRKGYGYSNLSDDTINEKCPDKACIWYIDLVKNLSSPIIKYSDLAKFNAKDTMKDAEHKVNHIMLNLSGKRFMVLHRWINNSKKFTRLVTIDVDGSDLFNLSDDDMTSHCYWKNDDEILAYARKKDIGDAYYLMKDKTNDFVKLWDELRNDGHPSYSPNGNTVITDTYPDRHRLSHLYYINEGQIKNIAKVFSPFRYDNDFRCDLHPRWNRKGDKVCIDSVFEGKRGLYVIPINSINSINSINDKN